MEVFNPEELKKLYIPPAGSHKGQNGKLLVIGGSHLFHAASLWALTIASRIVDMVFYSSVPENNQVIAEAKREFRNGIIVPRDDLDRYASEADVIMIGPGMLRVDKSKVESPADAKAMAGRRKSKESHKGTTFFEGSQVKIQKLSEINALEDEGEQTYYLTKYLLEKYPEKKWVIDAGALQMMELEWLKQLEGRVVLTPHEGEFERLFNFQFSIFNFQSNQNDKILKKQNIVEKMARKYNCIVLLKGHEDIVCSSEKCMRVAGGNAGMTKGGTGDVLAGLVGAFACKNDLWLSAIAASYINKKAGDSLFEKVGYYFNASDLVDEIPRVMKELIIEN